PTIFPKFPAYSSTALGSLHCETLKPPASFIVPLCTRMNTQSNISLIAFACFLPLSDPKRSTGIVNTAEYGFQSLAGQTIRWAIRWLFVISFLGEGPTSHS